MDIKQKKVSSYGTKFYVEKEGKEVAYAYLYVMTNVHEQPFGLMEYVFVDEELRGQGIGTKLVDALIIKAKELKCYKLIATSRFERERVHEWYKRTGFKEWGKEFRMDFE